jgi:hypothetical protein
MMKNSRWILASVLVLLGVATFSAAAENTTAPAAGSTISAEAGPSCKVEPEPVSFLAPGTDLLRPDGSPAPVPAACGCPCCNPWNYCRVHYGPQWYCDDASCLCEHF